MPRRLSRLSVLALVAGATLPASFAAQAQSSGYDERSEIMFNNAPVSADQWIVTVRGTIGMSPSWPGSDRMSFFGYPSIGYRKIGERAKFTSPTDSASIELYDTSWLRAGAVVGYSAGRYTSDERRLFALKDAGWSVQPGLFLDLWPTEFLRARIEARYAVGNAHGFVGMIGADFVKSFDRVTFAIGPRLKWGSDRFTNDMYGVRFHDVLMTAGLAQQYKAKGGVNSLGATASISYKWSDELTTTVYGAYDRLSGDAGSSPIVQYYGSRNQYTAGLSAAYSFTTRALW